MGGLTNMGIDELINKSKKGSITPIEKEYVLEQIKKEDDDLYSYLYIIGRSFFKEQEELFIKYLAYYKDPEIVKLSLQILCSFWGKTEKYLKYVIEYSKGCNWDESQVSRVMAISILGSYLGKKTNFDLQDKKIIKYLLRCYYDTNEKRNIREDCYLSLGEAFGKKPFKDLPFPGKNFDLVKDIDPKVIEWARKQIV